ncbi:MAG TPA: hypothetical protein VK066_01760 [Chloroflexota bacterium]|nr:hypothetical protein [Chloroflexota bacterium]
MAFELWSGASGNLLSIHETEADALSMVLKVAVANDAEYIASLGLLYDNGRRSRLIAQGAELVERARQASASDPSRRAARKQRASA